MRIPRIWPGWKLKVFLALFVLQLLYNSSGLFLRHLINGKIYTSRPHIVFIMADDLGWSDVSWNNPKIIMPNLDKLARLGVILNSSYVSPRCSPSRASLLTGYYPHRLGMQYGVSSNGRSLPLNFDLLPQKLKEGGYATHMVGKWHLGYCSVNHTPSHRGFDSFFGFYEGHQSYHLHTIQKMYDFHFNDQLYIDTQSQYSTFLFRDRVLDIIQNHDSTTPLFLYVPFQSVHAPLEVPERYSNLYPGIPEDRAKYCGMVTAMDEAIGDITSALQSKGLTDNLLLVFTSDNGGHPIKGGYNWPLRGVKNTLWEGGTRSPGFVYSPTLLKYTKYTMNHVINIADWFPTLLEAAGLPVDTSHMDGISQWKTLTNGGDAARLEHVYGIEGRAAIRVGDYKLIRGHPGCPQDSPAITCVPYQRMDNGWLAPNELGGRFRLGDKEMKDYQLFNLKTDPLEEVDVADRFPDVVEKLKARLNFHQQRSVEPVENVPLTPKFSKILRKHKILIPGWCDN